MAENSPKEIPPYVVEKEVHLLDYLHVIQRRWRIALIVFLLVIPTRLFFRVKVHGRKRLAAGGEYIVVARHRSYWDVAVLAVALGWPNRVHYIARKGLLPLLPFLQPVRARVKNNKK